MLIHPELADYTAAIKRSRYAYWTEAHCPRCWTVGAPNQGRLPALCDRCKGEK